MTAQFYPKQVDYIDKLNALHASVTAAVTASGIINVPAGNISATNVQSALNELDTEKQPLDATLTALAAVVTAANKIIYATASDTFSTLDLDTDGTLAANSDTKLASQKAVKTYVDASVVGLFDLKGATDASTNPNYPAASKADIYVVSVAGKVGGASGVSVDIGDMYLSLVDNAGGTQASVGTSWVVLEHNLVGALLSANNLSDITSASSARTNLGLGTLATQNGTFSGTSSGTNTGDQTITLTGGVTGSGTGSFVATVITNANLTGPITSVGNATSVAAQTGTGTTFVMQTSPTLTTPTLGVATATSINGLTITTSTGTLTVTNGKTASILKTLSFDGTDSTTMIFPTTSATIARTDAGQTFTGNQVITGNLTNTGNVTLTDAYADVVTIVSGDITLGDSTNSQNIVKIKGLSTGTTIAAAAGNSAGVSLYNLSATDNNFNALGGYNSNSLVDSQIAFVHTSHGSRTGNIALMTHDGSSLATRVLVGTAGAAITGTGTISGTAVLGGTSAILNGGVTMYGDGATVNQLVIADTRAYSTPGEVRQIFACKYTSGGSYQVMSDIRGGKLNATDGNQLGYLDIYVNNNSGVTKIARFDSTALGVSVPITASNGTAIPAGGTAGAGIMVSSTANFGVFFGSGAPTLSAAKGSLYLRSDGSGIADRMYVNTNGSTTWTNVVTAA